MQLTDSHEKIYDALLYLVKEHSPVFTYNHIAFDENFYRVFFYNYCTYEKFMLPHALECRGITFEVDEDGNFIRLASLPMEKFFNYKENPLTMNIENEVVAVAMFKEDGSLMSSLLHKNKPYLKSKGHLFSEQAIAANCILNQDPILQSIIADFEDQEHTVNLEYTSPENQIVLPYQKSSLTILNVRNRRTGLYIPYDILYKKDIIRQYLVVNDKQHVGKTMDDFFNEIKSLENIEGYVAQVNEQFVKVKTDWYCIRHNALDTFNPFSKKGQKRLLNAIINEETDDVKQILENNKYMLDIIEASEKFFAEYLENSEEKAENFIQENQSLDRKDFYQKAQKTFSGDSILLNYTLKKMFNPNDPKFSSLIEQVKINVEKSKFTAFYDFISKFKNINFDE